MVLWLTVDNAAIKSVRVLYWFLFWRYNATWWIYLSKILFTNFIYIILWCFCCVQSSKIARNRVLFTCNVIGRRSLNMDGVRYSARAFFWLLLERVDLRSEDVFFPKRVIPLQNSAADAMGVLRRVSGEELEALRDKMTRYLPYSAGVSSDFIIFRCPRT